MDQRSNWQTIKEISEETGISERSVFRLADKMVRQGEWEFRLRKLPRHWAKEYRRIK